MYLPITLLLVLYTLILCHRNLLGQYLCYCSGENGEIGIGIRRAMKQHSHICTKLCQQSSQNIQLGALAAVVHAVSIGSLFHLQYHPWWDTNDFKI